MPGTTHLTFARLANTIAEKYVEIENDSSKGKSVQKRVLSYNIQVTAFNVATALVIGTVALAVFSIVSIQAALVMGGLFLLARHLVHRELKEKYPPNKADVFTTLGINPVHKHPWNPDFVKISGYALFKNFIQGKDYSEKRGSGGGEDLSTDDPLPHLKYTSGYSGESAPERFREEEADRPTVMVKVIPMGTGNAYAMAARPAETLRNSNAGSGKGGRAFSPDSNNSWDMTDPVTL